MTPVQTLAGFALPQPCAPSHGSWAVNHLRSPRCSLSPGVAADHSNGLQQSQPTAGSGTLPCASKSEPPPRIWDLQVEAGQVLQVQGIAGASS